MHKEPFRISPLEVETYRSALQRLQRYSEELAAGSRRYPVESILTHRSFILYTQDQVVWLINQLTQQITEIDTVVTRITERCTVPESVHALRDAAQMLRGNARRLPNQKTQAIFVDMAEIFEVAATRRESAIAAAA